MDALPNYVPIDEASAPRAPKRPRSGAIPAIFVCTTKPRFKIVGALRVEHIAEYTNEEAVTHWPALKDVMEHNKRSLSPLSSLSLSRYVYKKWMVLNMDPFEHNTNC